MCVGNFFDYKLGNYLIILIYKYYRIFIVYT